MNTKQLTYFIEIAKQRNMNKAAEQLFVSQSSLSQYLSRLEDEMGTPLFYRQKGNMTLTPAGQLYLECAQKIIALKNELIRDIASLSSPTHIKVGINSIWGNTMMTVLTTQFRVKHPEITIEIFEENHRLLKKLVTDGEIDIAIITTDSIDALQGYGEILRYEELLFAISGQNAYFDAHPKPDGVGHMDLIDLVRQFEKENFILTKQTSSFRGMIDRNLAACNFTPSIICEISNMNTVRNMVSHNLGVAFIPSSCADTTLGLDICYYSITPRLERINAMIHSKTLAFSDAEVDFMNLVREYPLFKKKNN